MSKRYHISQDLLKFFGITSVIMLGWQAQHTRGEPIPDHTKHNSSDRPNIIFLMADDLGYGDLSCYGATKISTPNIDRLARQGIRFTNAYAPAALCTPTRYGVLTGRYCWRSRLKEWVLLGHEPPLIESHRLTVAELFKQQGYATACIGKWHLGFIWQTKDGTPPDEEGRNVDYTKPLTGGPLEQGFDYFFGIDCPLDRQPYSFIENDHTVGIPSVEKSPRERCQKPGLMAPGWKDKDVGPTFTQKAIDFLEKHVEQHPEKPFFLYLPSSTPHAPWAPPDFIKGKSQAGPRGDMIVELDWTTGKLMKTLRRLNIANNTLFIFTSDNGPNNTEPFGHYSAGKLRGYKGDIWEGGLRVPFIARWPGTIKPGLISDEIICLTDLFATCAAILKIQLPSTAAEDSYNILPALLGQKITQPIRQATVLHSAYGMFAIRQGPWKLIFGLGSGGPGKFRNIEPKPGEPEGQLYNLDKDPAEKNNLWFQHPDIVEHLTKLLDKYKKQGHSRRDL